MPARRRLRPYLTAKTMLCLRRRRKAGFAFILPPVRLQALILYFPYILPPWSIPGPRISFPFCAVFLSSFRRRFCSPLPREYPAHGVRFPQRNFSYRAWRLSFFSKAVSRGRQKKGNPWKCLPQDTVRTFSPEYSYWIPALTYRRTRVRYKGTARLF